MLKEDNPLATGGLYDDPSHTRFYGEDPDGPTPFEDGEIVSWSDQFKYQRLILKNWVSN